MIKLHCPALTTSLCFWTLILYPRHANAGKLSYIRSFSATGIMVKLIAWQGTFLMQHACLRGSQFRLNHPFIWVNSSGILHNW